LAIELANKVSSDKSNPERNHEKKGINFALIELIELVLLDVTFKPNVIFSQFFD
jgi:hypothetical protein